MLDAIKEKNLTRIKMLMELEKYDKALELCYDILASFPQYEEIHGVLANIYFYQKKFEKAQEHFALIPPSLINTAFCVALNVKLLYFSQKYDASWDAITHGLSIYPNDTEILNIKCRILLLRGKIKEAFKICYDILEIEPQNSWAKNLLLSVSIQKRDNVTAEKLIKELAENDPNQKLFISNLIENDRKRRKFDAMHKKTKHALSLYPTDEDFQKDLFFTSKMQIPFYRKFLSGKYKVSSDLISYILPLSVMAFVSFWVIWASLIKGIRLDYITLFLLQMAYATLIIYPDFRSFKYEWLFSFYKKVKPKFLVRQRLILSFISFISSWLCLILVFLWFGMPVEYKQLNFLFIGFAFGTLGRLIYETFIPRTKATRRVFEAMYLIKIGLILITILLFYLNRNIIRIHLVFMIFLFFFQAYIIINDIQKSKRE